MKKVKKMELKDLINERNESLLSLSQNTKVARQTLHNIINGTRTPSLLTVKKICSYFNVDWHDYYKPPVE